MRHITIYLDAINNYIGFCHGRAYTRNSMNKKRRCSKVLICLLTWQAWNSLILQSGLLLTPLTLKLKHSCNFVFLYELPIYHFTIQQDLNRMKEHWSLRFLENGTIVFEDLDQVAESALESALEADHSSPESANSTINFMIVCRLPILNMINICTVIQSADTSQPNVAVS